MIKADPLGLEVIYIQAKKWEQYVCRPEIQKFAGSLESGRAKKGVFITTSGFSSDAQEASVTHQEGRTARALRRMATSGGMRGSLLCSLAPLSGTDSRARLRAWLLAVPNGRVQGQYLLLNHEPVTDPWSSSFS